MENGVYRKETTSIPTSISIGTHMHHQTGKLEHCEIYSNEQKLLVPIMKLSYEQE